jgi:hypothetical protein
VFGFADVRPHCRHDLISVRVDGCLQFPQHGLPFFDGRCFHIPLVGALQRKDAFDFGGRRHSHPSKGNHSVPQFTNTRRL